MNLSLVKRAVPVLTRWSEREMLLMGTFDGNDIKSRLIFFYFSSSSLSNSK
jgi:hypothetical protein